MFAELYTEILDTYQRHGWDLRRVLLTPETRRDLDDQLAELFGGAKLFEAELDALWFARSSHVGREAWELRHLAKEPYALFAAFEPDETEAEREEARLEMEHQMREQVTGK